MKFDINLLDDDVKNDVPAPKTFSENNDNFPIAYAGEGFYRFCLIGGINHKGNPGIYFKQNIRDIMLRGKDSKNNSYEYKTMVVDNSALESIFADKIENKVEDSWRFKSKAIYWMAIYPLIDTGDYVKKGVPTTLVFREFLFGDFYSKWMELSQSDKVNILNNGLPIEIRIEKVPSKKGITYTNITSIEFLINDKSTNIPDYTAEKWSEKQETLWDGKLESLYINKVSNAFDEAKEKQFIDWINYNSSIKYAENVSPKEDYDTVEVKRKEEEIGCPIVQDFNKGKIERADYEGFYGKASFGNHAKSSNPYCNGCMHDTQCTVKSNKK